jgi:acyl dehydratase
VSTPGPGLVGATAGPLDSLVDARWLMAYAAALGEDDPRYYDTAAPAGPAAHPLFPVCYEWPVAVALRERVIDAALAPRSVHATHALTLHRAPRAGDRLRTSARVTAVEPRPAGTRVTVRFETVDAGGAPVSTTDYGSVYRGIGPADPAVPPPAAPPAPALRWTAPLEVPAQAAHVYTECARIWNPIHTDVSVARAAGLPGLILHGTATLALAVSRLVARELGGDPAAAGRIGARFTGMVRLPSRLTLRLHDTPGAALSFEVCDAAGHPVLSHGALEPRESLSRTAPGP